MNSAASHFVSIINEHNEARQTGCAHESTDLLPSCNGNDLQAGKGRSLQDDVEKETLEGNGRRLRIYGAWQEQKRKRVATGGNVYELLEAAFQTAKQAWMDQGAIHTRSKWSERDRSISSERDRSKKSK
jgi:hypothetical protein